VKEPERRELLALEIKKIASAGTMESSDVLVEIEPGFGGLDIQLESVVKVQYGAAIEATVRDVLQELDVTDACVRVNDRGALDCVIRARVETAVLRGKGEV
jgi:citrate lyase subunit gamma (acyl carrier protein)